MAYTLPFFVSVEFDYALRHNKITPWVSYPDLEKMLGASLGTEIITG